MIAVSQCSGEHTGLRMQKPQQAGGRLVAEPNIHYMCIECTFDVSFRPQHSYPVRLKSLAKVIESVDFSVRGSEVVLVCERRPHFHIVYLVLKPTGWFGAKMVL